MRKRLGSLEFVGSVSRHGDTVCARLLVRRPRINRHLLAAFYTRLGDYRSAWADGRCVSLGVNRYARSPYGRFWLWLHHDGVRSLNLRIGQTRFWLERNDGR
jgi:hypothetical protein